MPRPITAPDSTPLGLYVHIPFCRRKCAYCDFYSLSGADEQTMDRYLGALLRQIEETAATVIAPVDTIYFGGGTPTVFGAERIAKLLSLIHKKFKVEKTAEITCEANPESSDKKTLKTLRRAGVNRVSFGVQSACDAELAAIGRLHTFDEARAAVDAARAAGISNISLDLMYGLEGQTPESWAKTLADALALEPRHVSAYGLKVEEGTPLFARVDGGLILPDDDVQADMYHAACRVLATAGYEHYEISNWAKPGFESRHNLRYWRLQPYCGFGAAAASDCFGARSSAPRDLERYVAAVENGEEVFEDYERIPAAERAFEYVMLSLRTVRGVERDRLMRAYRLDPHSADEVLAALEREGLVTTSETHFALTEQGFLLSNTLILRIFDALAPLRSPFAKETI